MLTTETQAAGPSGWPGGFASVLHPGGHDVGVFDDLVGEVCDTDDDGLLVRLRAVEARRRVDAAEEAVVLAELERRKVYTHDAHATMWGLLRSTVGWSDQECRVRMRIARLVAEHSDAGDGLFETAVSVANIAEVARGFANPRCGDQIEAVIGTLLTEAARQEHDDFKVIVKRWERLADVDGSHRDQATGHSNRNAHVGVWSGVGHVAGRWGELDGVANREIFDQYVNAEWHADWETTVAQYGDQACKVLMPRTDAQRRADALTNIFAAAATTPKDAVVSRPVVNIHLDYHSFCDLMVEAELFPKHVTNPFETGTPLVTGRRCETGHGDPIDPKTVLQTAIESYIRFIIHDDHGIPLKWGRKRRLFTGVARDAVMSLSPRCTHPGCRVRTGRSQADHTTDWNRQGKTDPDNGNPRCARHNLIKNRGYTVERDRQGNWHTYRPNGTEIC